MMEYEFSAQAMIRGYHIYQNNWDAACDGKLLNWRIKYLKGKKLAFAIRYVFVKYRGKNLAN